MPHLDRLIRRHEAQRVLGDIGETKFKEMRRAGVVPEPDVWLGPRSPAWFESTIAGVISALAQRGRQTEAA